MKRITSYLVALVLIVTVAVPYMVLEGVTSSHEAKEDKGTEASAPVEVEKNEYNISVYLRNRGVTVTVPLEEYVTCVVASEMPSDFEPEALKTQAVAARTFGIARQGNLCNTVHCQAYKTKSELIARNGQAWADMYWDKIEKAVAETAGLVLTYDGELVQQAMFFSSSGGRTENSEDIFQTKVPYLRSVSSRVEPEATHSNDTYEFPMNKFISIINSIGGATPVNEKDVRRTKVIKRSQGGSVQEIRIGDNVFSGSEIKKLFGITSMKYYLRVVDGNVLINSRGFGHGVGLSQYGANGMAKKGYTFDKILTHYYKGVEIKNIHTDPIQ